MAATNRRLEADQARSYQLEMFEFAKKHNTIVVLGTGTGKTFISVLLIKHFEHQVHYQELALFRKYRIFILC